MTSWSTQTDIVYYRHVSYGNLTERSQTYCSFIGPVPPDDAECSSSNGRTLLPGCSTCLIDCIHNFRLQRRIKHLGLRCLIVCGECFFTLTLQKREKTVVAKCISFRSSNTVVQCSRQQRVIHYVPGFIGWEWLSFPRPLKYHHAETPLTFGILA